MAGEEIESIFPEWCLSPWPQNHISSYFATSFPTWTENNVGILLIAIAVEWAEAQHLYLSADEYPEHPSCVRLNGGRNPVERALALQILCAGTVFSCIHEACVMGNLNFVHVMY